MMKLLRILAAIALCAGNPAWAFSAAKHGAVASSIHITSGCTSLGSDLSISGQLFELDATCSSSTDGSSQTWANIVASPADSSTQTAYDFYRGVTSSATTDDPTFNGSAGSSSAYWSVDGGDLFQIAAGNTTALKNLHKTTGGQAFTIIFAMKTPSSLPSDAPFFSTGGGNDGLALEMQSGTTSLKYFQFRGGALSSTTAYTSVATSTDYLIALGGDYTGSGNYSRAVNETSFTSAALTKGATTTDADHAANLMGSVSYGSYMPNGSRLYGVYVWNAVLTNGNLSSIVTALNTRHGRTYALLDMRSNVRYAMK